MFMFLFCPLLFLDRFVCLRVRVRCESRPVDVTFWSPQGRKITYLPDTRRPKPTFCSFAFKSKDVKCLSGESDNQGGTDSLETFLVSPEKKMNWWRKSVNEHEQEC